MILISGSSNLKLAQEVASGIKAELVVVDSYKFPDQEIKISLEKNLSGQEVIILQSTSKPVNDNLVELLMLSIMVKQLGARRITLVVPYFSYSRQDKPIKLNENYTVASIMANLIEATGADKLITIDLHSSKTEEFFKIPVYNLSPETLFAEKFKESTNLVVVSPDNGAAERARNLANLLEVDLAIFSKIRRSDGVCEIGKLDGEVEDKDCLLIDDIIDTGGTLLQAAEILLNSKKAKSVSACVTHGVFSKNLSDELRIFKEFYLTDTINNKSLPENIKLISVADLIKIAI